QVAEFILMGFPGIHEWQHCSPCPWLSLGANLLIIITIQHETMLHEPMYHLLGILAVVDIGLATTIMPKILAIFWFDAKAISLPECFTQIYAIHSFMCMESGIFLCMAVDRYMAICYPIQYTSIVTEAFVIKATLSVVLRNGLLTIPVLVLAAQRHYCSRNEIDHCLCSNLGVTSLACFTSWPWSGLWFGNDTGLVFASYSLIIRSVLKLNSAKATSKALNTCSSHLILILFFYTAIIVVSVTHLAGRRAPLIPVLLNVLHIVIPPALNPMVYGRRTQELRVGFQKLL
uniref:G-protein coupled receptors family 1 profile domain-containing protein n=1 Tax=Nomascus leucogenys TaxID=61853 RepID=G1S6F9_NOMLE